MSFKALPSPYQISLSVGSGWVAAQEQSLEECQALCLENSLCWFINWSPAPSCYYYNTVDKDGYSVFDTESVDYSGLGIGYTTYVRGNVPILPPVVRPTTTVTSAWKWWCIALIIVLAFILIRKV